MDCQAISFQNNQVQAVEAELVAEVMVVMEEKVEDKVELVGWVEREGLVVG